MSAVEDTSFPGFLDWLYGQIGEGVYREAMGLRHVPDPPRGCECGAELHEGPHEGALACEEARLRDGCSCDGYWCEETREVVHDGYCDLAEEP